MKASARVTNTNLAQTKMATMKAVQKPLLVDEYFSDLVVAVTLAHQASFLRAHTKKAFFY